MISLNSVVLAAGALAVGAGAAAARLEDTVAVVNGTPILLSEYQKEFSTAVEYWSRAEPDAMRDPATLKKLRETALEEMINRELLFQEGGKLKVKVRERDVDNRIEQLKQKFAKDENGRDVPQAEAEAAFQKQLKADGLSYGQLREKLNKVILTEKLIDQAVKSKVSLPEEKEVRAYFDRIKAFIVKKSTQAPSDMDEEAAAAFRQIAQQVKAMSSERVRVSRILIKTSPGASAQEKKRALKTAQELRKSLVAGASSFAEVAREESEDPESAARGGDIGYVIRGVAPPEFEKAAYSLPLGEVSQPIDTEIGYHIITVTAKHAAETPDYDRFKEDLGRFLAEVSFRKELDAFVKSLRAKAVIDRSLPPTLQ